MIKLFLNVCTLIGLSWACPLWAKSAFDGVWRPDATSLRSNTPPTVIILNNGMFGRNLNQPGLIKADGNFYTTKGDDYVDEVAVKVIDRFHVEEVDKLKGKVLYKIKYTVSDDSKKLTTEVVSLANPAALPVSSKTTYRRVSPWPPNQSEHLLSGSWKQAGIRIKAGASDITLKIKDKRFSYWTRQGVGYEADINGKPVKIVGDDAQATASITMPNRDTVIERDYLHGVESSTMTLQLMKNNRRIKMTSRSSSNGEYSTIYFEKHSR